MPKIIKLEADSQPGWEIVRTAGSGPVLRILQQGSGNAIEVVNAAGTVLWSVSKGGTPSA